MAFQASSLSFNGNVSLREISVIPCLGIKRLNKKSNYASTQTFGRSKTSVKPCRAKFEGNSGETKIPLEIEAMERDLSMAIAEENYDRAAKIRDNLKILKENGKAHVLVSNSRFYEAFREGDLAAMQALWARNGDVCCVHPGARGINGYDDVITSWEYVWANYEFPLDIELKDVNVSVRGDMGYVTCVELVRTKGSSWGGQFVTNVFERVHDQWLICVHHASPIEL